MLSQLELASSSSPRFNFGVTEKEDHAYHIELKVNYL